MARVSLSKSPYLTNPFDCCFSLLVGFGKVHTSSLPMLRVHVSWRIYYGRRQVDKLNMEISVCRGSLFRGGRKKPMYVYIYVYTTHTHNPFYFKWWLRIRFVYMCAREVERVNFWGCLLAPNKSVGLGENISWINWLAIAIRVISLRAAAPRHLRARRAEFFASRFGGSTTLTPLPGNIVVCAREHLVIILMPFPLYLSRVSERAAEREKTLRGVLECRPLITLWPECCFYCIPRPKGGSNFILCIHAADERGKNGWRLM